MSTCAGNLSAQGSAAKGIDLPAILPQMPQPTGFSYTRRKDGDVVITHHGRRAAVLRGAPAERFVDKLTESNGQELMARATGNYKRGNERRRREKL